MCASARQSSQRRQQKQRDAYVAEKQNGTEGVRLLTNRDDLLAGVPREWEANRNLMAAESRGNGRDHNRDDRKKSPFDGSAHKPPTRNIRTVVRILKANTARLQRFS
jgi:hypothetical protein